MEFREQVKKKHFKEVRWWGVRKLGTDLTHFLLQSDKSFGNLCPFKTRRFYKFRFKSLSHPIVPFLTFLLNVACYAFFFFPFMFVSESEGYIKNCLKSSRSLVAAPVTLIKIKDRLDIKLLKGSSNRNWKYPIRKDRRNNPFNPQKYQR